MPANLIRSGIVGVTEGYGNTRDSLSLTEDRIRENDIAQRGWKERFADIIGAPLEKETKDEMINALWLEYVELCPDKRAAINQLYGMISNICYGPVDNWLGLPDWLKFEFEEVRRKKRAA